MQSNRFTRQLAEESLSKSPITHQASTAPHGGVIIITQRRAAGAGRGRSGAYRHCGVGWKGSRAVQRIHLLSCCNGQVVARAPAAPTLRYHSGDVGWLLQATSATGWRPRREERGGVGRGRTVDCAQDARNAADIAVTGVMLRGSPGIPACIARVHTARGVAGRGGTSHVYMASNAQVQVLLQ